MDTNEILKQCIIPILSAMTEKYYFGYILTDLILTHYVKIFLHYYYVKI